jgi:hypothetical protein
MKHDLETPELVVKVITPTHDSAMAVVRGMRQPVPPLPFAYIGTGSSRNYLRIDASSRTISWKYSPKFTIDHHAPTNGFSRDFRATATSVCSPS